MKEAARVLIYLTLTAMFGRMALADAALTVVVSGARDARGQVLATLFDSPEGFLKAPFREGSAPVNERGSATIELGAAPPGGYAVSVIHDRNGNGKLDTNFLGIPTEPVGFSNNASAAIGPPTFQSARFDHNDAHTTIVIDIGR